jgi:NADH dehydrogenase [ubiquinone] 1 alpha subcomplex assembly factor 7
LTPVSPDSPVVQAIQRAIAAAGSISFREFMTLALYHPDGGYYMRRGMTTGRAGDFATMSDISPAFGRRLAAQVAEFVRAGDGPWTLLELGPGRGWLMHDLLEALAAPPREVLLIETSPALRELQQQRLAGARCPIRWHASLDELTTPLGRTVIVANEFFDALPVEWLIRRGTTIYQRRVDASLRFVETELSDSALLHHLATYRLCEADRDQAEVRFEVERALARLSEICSQAAMIAIDYGYETAPAQGSVLAYRDHSAVANVLANPGEQDITAHVDWTHFDRSARAAGFDVLGRTTQDRFLMALGIADDMVGESGEARAARSLVIPAAAGKSFQVTLLSKQIPITPSGLRFARSAGN